MELIKIRFWNWAGVINQYKCSQQISICLSVRYQLAWWIVLVGLCRRDWKCKANKQIDRSKLFGKKLLNNVRSFFCLAPCYIKNARSMFIKAIHKLKFSPLTPCLADQDFKLNNWSDAFVAGNQEAVKAMVAEVITTKTKSDNSNFTGK